MFRSPGLTCVALLLAAAPALAGHDQTDVVKTKDGSTYIGELKSIQYATLNLDTSAAGLLSIEWRHVASVTSSFDYRVETSGGTRHYGTLGPSKEPDHLVVISSTGPVEIPFDDLFEAVPIEHGFWKRLDGSVNFGLTYTQANRALQYNLNGDAYYRTRKNYASLTAQTILNSQEAGDTTKQSLAQLMLGQAGRHTWGTFEIGQLQSNPDQGYDLRFIAGGGGVNFLIESARQMLSLNLGLVYNHENVADGGGVDDSAEALAVLGYRRFKRDSHSPGVQLSLATFTNVTDTPRFRFQLNFNVSWKIVGDFKFSVQMTDMYDSDPPGTDAQHNDLTLVTSLGYSF